MKKVLSILLIAIASLMTGNMFAQEPATHKLNIKINVKDNVYGDPVDGEYIDLKLDYYTDNIINKYNAVVKRNLGPSGTDGVINGFLEYSHASDGQRVDIMGTSGIHIFTSTASGFSPIFNNQVFSLNNGRPHTPSLNYNGKIYNVVGGNWIAKVPDTYWDNFRFDGVRWAYEDGASVEIDLYVTDDRPTRKIRFDTSMLSNAGDYHTIELNKGEVFNVNSLPIPQFKDSRIVFDYWAFNGERFESGNINRNMVLTPVYKPAGPIQGIIHYKVYMWDHDAYEQNPNRQIPSYFLTGKNNNGTVKCRYSLYDYQHNAGWTTIPVSGITMNARQYKNEPGDPKDVNYFGSSITDDNGEATLVLSADEVQNVLKDGYVIDIEPITPTNRLAKIYRKPEWGYELCACYYDMEIIRDPQGAGVMGVRYVVEGPRHEDTGIQLADFNDNDAMLLTDIDKEVGFEFTFVCFVTPAPAILFDVNGGTMPVDTDSDKYPIQIFDPINSASVPISPWIVQFPGDPTAPPADEHAPKGYDYDGWHEVRTDTEGNEYIDPNPYKFGTFINHSSVVRAIYSIHEDKYDVRWVPDNWDYSDENVYEMSKIYKNKQLPSFNSELPNKEGYKFLGWDVYVQDETGTMDFGELGKYKFVKTLYQPKEHPVAGEEYMTKVEVLSSYFWQSNVAIDDASQIYVAKFASIQTITVEKSGLGKNDSAIFTIKKGDEIRKIVLTGDGSDSVSKTIMVDTGKWTVKEETNWSWAYEPAAETSQDVTVNECDRKTVKFANIPKTPVPSHDEKTKNNVFTK